jgi:ribosomal protein S18 acetylase RimI-like enzyme
VYDRWGMGSTRLIGGDFLVLSMLGTEPGYQGHGAASQLIRYGLDRVDESGLLHRVYAVGIVSV